MRQFSLLACFILFSSVGFSQSAFDDFEDGVLNPSLWIVNGPGTVTEENGQAVSRSRGHLTSVSEFDPFSLPFGLKLSGRIQWISRVLTEPSMKICWRSEQSVTGPFFEAMSGAALIFGEPVPSQGIIRQVVLSDRVNNIEVDIASFQVLPGEFVSFEIADQAGFVTADVTNISTGQTVQLAGSMPNPSLIGNYVKFYTREAPYNTTAGLEEIWINHPALAVVDLIAGSVSTAEISSCTPNGNVILSWSAAGGGPISTPWGAGLVSPPHVLKYLAADASGALSYSHFVPSGLLGSNVWFHGVDLSSGTLFNPVVVLVQ